MRINAVLSLFGAAAWATEGNPMVTVLEELEKLRNRINAEMEEEAKNYEDYACYCRDTQEEKSERLTALGSDKDAQVSTIQQAEDDQSALRDDINRKKDDDRGNLAQIEYLENLIRKNDKAEADAVERHNADAHELETAIDACKNAVKTLQKGIGMQAFIQTPMAQQVIALGQAMGYEAATALVQAAPSVDDSDNANSVTNSAGVTQQLRDDSGSRDVIAMVEELLNKFRKDLKDLTNERMQNNDAFNTAKQENTQLLMNEKGTLERNQKELAKTTELLQNTQKEYTQTTRMIDQDTVYLNDLANECTKAKKEYDQRSAFSLEELQMLAMTETILKESAAAHFNAAGEGDFNLTGLVQTETANVGRDCNVVHQEWRDARDGEEIDGWTAKLRAKQSLIQKKPASAQASLLETFSQAPAFLQRRMAVNPHNEVAEILRSSAQQIGSPTLAALATKVDSMAPGVFDRVNTLIRELITRLQKEQSKDIAHHGFCNQQMAEMKQQRDTAKANMDEAAANANSAYARSERLRASINELQIENAETQRAWMEAQRIYQCATEQNAQMSHEASKGQEALEGAIETVSSFFEKMKDSANSGDAGSSQQGGAADAPGNDSAKSKALAGKQTGRSQNWENIVALMETMKDEMIKTQEDTATSQADATKEYNQFESDSRADMSAKHATREQKKAERAEANSQLQEENDKFASELDQLNSALKMWEDLRQSCQSEGVTPQERAAKRQAEIAALKKALDVLNQVTAH